MVIVLYKINRNKKWHEEIALKHYLKYCTSEKCIRPEHQKKANWHEGFCLECVFNPYNIEDELDVCQRRLLIGPPGADPGK